jgi:hypothetical protein
MTAKEKKLKGIRSTFISQWETLTLSKPTLSKTLRMIKEQVENHSGKNNYVVFN